MEIWHSSYIRSYNISTFYTLSYIIEKRKSWFKCNRVGKGNLLLRHFVPHAPPNFTALNFQKKNSKFYKEKRECAMDIQGVKISCFTWTATFIIHITYYIFVSKLKTSFLINKCSHLGIGSKLKTKLIYLNAVSHIQQDRQIKPSVKTLRFPRVTMIII